jgi:hypothetical protein
LTLKYIGARDRLFILGSNGSDSRRVVESDGVSFSVANPAVAAVSGDGTVRAIAEGSTAIEILGGGAIARCDVVVAPPPTPAIEVTAAFADYGANIGRSPYLARPGDLVVIESDDLAMDPASHRVTFGDAEAQILCGNPEPCDAGRLVVRVPMDATVGPLRIEAGAASSANLPFEITTGPILTGVDPPMARVGDTVRLLGAGFSDVSNDLLLDVGEDEARSALPIFASENELVWVVIDLPDSPEVSVRSRGEVSNSVPLSLLTSVALEFEMPPGTTAADGPFQIEAGVVSQSTLAGNGTAALELSKGVPTLVTATNREGRVVSFAMAHNAARMQELSMLSTAHAVTYLLVGLFNLPQGLFLSLAEDVIQDLPEVGALAELLDSQVGSGATLSDALAAEPITSAAEAAADAVVARIQSSAVADESLQRSPAARIAEHMLDALIPAAQAAPDRTLSNAAGVVPGYAEDGVQITEVTPRKMTVANHKLRYASVQVTVEEDTIVPHVGSIDEGLLEPRPWPSSLWTLGEFIAARGGPKLLELPGPTGARATLGRPFEGPGRYTIEIVGPGLFTREGSDGIDGAFAGCRALPLERIKTEGTLVECSGEGWTPESTRALVATTLLQATDLVLSPVVSSIATGLKIGKGGGFDRYRSWLALIDGLIEDATDLTNPAGAEFAASFLVAIAKFVADKEPWTLAAAFGRACRRLGSGLLSPDGAIRALTENYIAQFSAKFLAVLGAGIRDQAIDGLFSAVFRLPGPWSVLFAVTRVANDAVRAVVGVLSPLGSRARFTFTYEIRPGIQSMTPTSLGWAEIDGDPSTPVIMRVTGASENQVDYFDWETPSGDHEDLFDGLISSPIKCLDDLQEFAGQLNAGFVAFAAAPPPPGEIAALRPRASFGRRFFGLGRPECSRWVALARVKEAERVSEDGEPLVVELEMEVPREVTGGPVVLGIGTSVHEGPQFFVQEDQPYLVVVERSLPDGPGAALWRQAVDARTGQRIVSRPKIRIPQAQLPRSVEVDPFVSRAYVADRSPATYSVRYTFGGSESDIQVFKGLGHPIALAPDGRLFGQRVDGLIGSALTSGGTLALEPAYEDPKQDFVVDLSASNAPGQCATYGLWSLAVRPDGRRLYALRKEGGTTGQQTGCVAVIDIDPAERTKGRSGRYGSVLRWTVLPAMLDEPNRVRIAGLDEALVVAQAESGSTDIARFDISGDRFEFMGSVAGGAVAFSNPDNYVGPGDNLDLATNGAIDVGISASDIFIGSGITDTSGSSIGEVKPLGLAFAPMFYSSNVGVAALRALGDGYEPFGYVGATKSGFSDEWVVDPFSTTNLQQFSPIMPALELWTPTLKNVVVKAFTFPRAIGVSQNGAFAVVAQNEGNAFVLRTAEVADTIRSSRRSGLGAHDPGDVPLECLAEVLSAGTANVVTDACLESDLYGTVYANTPLPAFFPADPEIEIEPPLIRYDAGPAKRSEAAAVEPYVGILEPAFNGCVNPARASVLATVVDNRGDHIFQVLEGDLSERPETWRDLFSARLERVDLYNRLVAKPFPVLGSFVDGGHYVLRVISRLDEQTRPAVTGVPFTVDTAAPSLTSVLVADRRDPSCVATPFAPEFELNATATGLCNRISYCRFFLDPPAREGLLEGIVEDGSTCKLPRKLEAADFSEFGRLTAVVEFADAAGNVATHTVIWDTPKLLADPRTSPYDDRITVEASPAGGTFTFSPAGGTVAVRDVENYTGSTYVGLDTCAREAGDVCRKAGEYSEGRAEVEAGADGGIVTIQFAPPTDCASPPLLSSVRIEGSP